MRIKKLQNQLIKKNLDLVVFFNLDMNTNSNMYYYSGYSGIGLLAVTKKKRFLLVPQMEYEKAKKLPISVFKTDKKKRLLENLSMILKGYKIKKVGFEEQKVSVYLYKKIRKAFKARYLDIGSICYSERMVKDKVELQNIKTACQITDKIFKKIAMDFKFKTEGQLRKFIVESIFDVGCDLAFPPIVASGKSSSQAHYDSDNKIKKGFLMLDFGAKYRGYCSDMTRMMFVGKPSLKELKDYDLVKNTLIKCEHATTSTKKFSRLYDLAIENLGENSEFFTHALGHGLGLDIHEPPSLYTEDKNRILENIPFTIEPGIYFPDKYGIRIEDTVVLQNNTLKVLTKSSKDLVRI